MPAVSLFHQTDCATEGTDEPPQQRSSGYSRSHADLDRYIRRVKGEKYQARPYNRGTQIRDDLGLFPSREAARIAIREYFQGKRRGLPRFTKAIHLKGGLVRFLVLVPVGSELVKVGRYKTREQAAQAAVRFVKRTFGERANEILVGRRAISRTHYVPVTEQKSV